MQGITPTVRSGRCSAPGSTPSAAGELRRRTWDLLLSLSSSKWLCGASAPAHPGARHDDERRPGRTFIASVRNSAFNSSAVVHQRLSFLVLATLSVSRDRLCWSGDNHNSEGQAHEDDGNPLHEGLRVTVRWPRLCPPRGMLFRRLGPVPPGPSVKDKERRKVGRQNLGASAGLDQLSYAGRPSFGFQTSKGGPADAFAPTGPHVGRQLVIPRRRRTSGRSRTGCPRPGSARSRWAGRPSARRRKLRPSSRAFRRW